MDFKIFTSSLLCRILHAPSIHASPLLLGFYTAGLLLQLWFSFWHQTPETISTLYFFLNTKKKSPSAAVLFDVVKALTEQRVHLSSDSRTYCRTRGAVLGPEESTQQLLSLAHTHTHTHTNCSLCPWCWTATLFWKCPVFHQGFTLPLCGHLYGCCTVVVRISATLQSCQSHVCGQLAVHSQSIILNGQSSNLCYLKAKLFSLLLFIFLFCSVKHISPALDIICNFSFFLPLHRRQPNILSVSKMNWLDVGSLRSTAKFTAASHISYKHSLVLKD